MKNIIIILNNITYNLIYNKNKTGNSIRREVVLFHNDKKIGHFYIEGESKPGHSNHFNSGNPCSMGIMLDVNYRTKGLSPIMIKYMVDNIERDYPKIRDDQYLYIDIDVSRGFWNSIGMKTYNNEEIGYEKRITFGELKKYTHKQLLKDKYKNMSIEKYTPVSPKKRTYRNSIKKHTRDSPKKRTYRKISIEKYTQN